MTTRDQAAAAGGRRPDGRARRRAIPMPAEGAVRGAVGAGCLQGLPGGSCGPLAPATRAQAAEMVSGQRCGSRARWDVVPVWGRGTRW